MMARHTRRSLALAAEKENSMPPAAPAPAPERPKKTKKRQQDEPSAPAGAEEAASQPPKKGPGKKRKKPPMQEDDGFEFRARRKSTRLSNMHSISAGISTEPAASSSTTSAAKTAAPPPPAPSAASGQKKPSKLPKAKASPEDVPTKPAKPAKPAKTKKPARRRDDVPAPAAARTRSPPPQPRRQHIQDTSMDDSIQSTESTRIRLRTNDTPVADRRKVNKYRQSGAGARRSSVGLRGRRASSLIQDGIVAEPHPTIAPEDYYKHINQELMEFMRMQQLLTWCGHKVLNDPPKAPRSTARRKEEVDDAAASGIARVIQEEILKEITTNGTLSNWMTRDTSSTSGLPPVIKKPNPENEKNLKKLDELKEELQRLDEEREAWRILEEMNPEDLMAVPNEMDPMLSIPAAGSSSTNANPDDPSSTSTPNPTTLPPSLSTATAITTQQRNQITAKTLLETPESQRATTLLGTSHDLLLATRDVVSRHASDLEFQVDQLADACHRINMYADVADGLAGKMLETVEKRLAEKERAIRERAGTEGLGTLEILRGLARFSE